MRPWPRFFALLTALATAPACGGCEDDPSGKVPFKRGSRAPGDDSPRPADSPADFEPATARTFPEGTTRVAVQGAPLQVASGSIRALLPLDLDDDGDRDVLIVRAGEEGSVTVEFGRRDDDAFQTVRSLGRVLAPSESCRVRKPSLRTVSPSFAILSVSRACEDSPERALAILAMADEPRVLERIVLLPEEGRTPGDIALGIRTTDVDGDEHEDVVLEVSVTPPGSEKAAKVQLPWLDRPGGLARDRAEPDETLTELADEAKKTLPKDARTALSLARRALALHGALCREGSAARLRFGDGGGLTCGQSAGAGRAAAVEAAALAREGTFFEALEAEGRLDEPGYAVGEAERKMVQAAWSRAPVPDGLSWRKVATHRPGAMPEVHLPAVAFSDPDTLLLRGESPQTVDLRSGEAEPAPEAAGAGLIQDPEGKLAVVDVRRTCEGHVLVIVRAGEVVAGVVAGRPIAEPLLEPKAPPSDARCPELPASARNDSGGWKILGWAPQGVVAARGATLRVVPLTVEGQPAGEPTVLEPGTSPPAPLPEGQATPDGHAYVLGSTHGVLLRKLGSESGTLLLRPEGWKAGGSAPSDVAVAADASRVALLRDGEVWVIEGLP